MKILNLYAGIGGNRKLWGEEHQITAIEYNPKIAAVYQDLYQNDTVIVADAHQYLKDNYQEFDFIWTSPPCQSHSSFRKNICVAFRGTKAEYPDLKLYEEIIFLQNFFKGKYIVENVKPYYKPLIEPNKMLHRHLIWSNLQIDDLHLEPANLRKAQIPDLQDYHQVDLSKYDLKGLDKRQILRNCVNKDLGKHLFHSYIKGI